MANETEQIDQAFQNALKKYEGQISKEEKEKIIEVYKKRFVEGKPIREALEITDEAMSIVYNVAFMNYNSGKFKEALSTFYLLQQLDGHEPKYVFGISACYHKMQNYDSAISFYLAYTFMAPEDPVPWFHLADCYEKQHRYKSAYKCLKQCISLGEDREEYSKIIEKAKLLIDKVKQDSEEHKRQKSQAES